MLVSLAISSRPQTDASEHDSKLVKLIHMSRLPKPDANSRSRGNPSRLLFPPLWHILRYERAPVR
jgi:hypothetical protein